MRKRGYHHGNLRAALIDAALKLIEEKGPTGFTLSEAAKQAGVTPAAVYRHFKGRKDLIASAALQGYQLFSEQMGYTGENKTGLEAFETSGLAYLTFARKYPGHYIAMFESGISVNHSPELAHASEQALGQLEHAASQLTKHMPADTRPPASMVAAHIWAMSHGVVELFARGSPGTQSPFPAEELLESGIGIYLRGLGLIPPDQ